MEVWFMLLLCTLGPADILGYPTGAPDKSCPGISPIHDHHEAQTGPSPYNLTLSKYTYTAGESVTVTLKSPEGESLIGGFMIQARRTTGDTNTPVGEFVTFDSQTSKLTCSQFQSKALTHTNGGVLMASVTATWKAPDPPVGQLIFYYAVAQSHDIYWGKQKGAILVGQTSASPQLYSPVWLILFAWMVPTYI